MVQPVICRSETDFPVPEPPRMTRTSPRRTFRSTSSSTGFDPNAFVTLRKLDDGEVRVALQVRADEAHHLVSLIVN